MLIPENLDKNRLRHIASVAWPMALNAILIESIIIVDLLLVASLGDNSVAAFGMSGALIAFVINIQYAIGNGTQLILSRAVGAGDILKIGLDFASGWVLNIVFSLLAIVVLFFFADRLIHLITDNEVVAIQAIAYIKISLLVLFISPLTTVVVAYFNAYKKTRIPLYGFMLEIPLNIICSAALINGLWGAPELGLAGAAWGSVVAITFRLVYLAYQYNQDRLRGNVSGLRYISFKSVISHFYEVIPIVANFIVIFTGLLVFQALFAQLPTSSYAAITLIMPWIKVGALFVNSWTQSTSIMVSQTIGKEDFTHIPDLVKQTKFISVIMAVVMVVSFLLFSLLLPSLYNNLSTDTIVALGVIAPIYILIPAFRVNNMFCGNMARAMGVSYLIVRINVITQWVISIPLCALLIYFDAPLLMIFGVILFDEILKWYPFRRVLSAQLERYSTI